MASDLVAAARPPLVSEVRTDGALESATSTRVVVMLTTWPVPLVSMSVTASCVSRKNPVRLTPMTVAKSSAV